MNLSTNFASACGERLRPASSSGVLVRRLSVQETRARVCLKDRSPACELPVKLAWHTTSVLADLCASTGIAASGARAPTAIPDRNLLLTRDQQRLRVACYIEFVLQASASLVSYRPLASQLSEGFRVKERRWMGRVKRIPHLSRRGIGWLGATVKRGFIGMLGGPFEPVTPRK